MRVHMCIQTKVYNLYCTMCCYLQKNATGMSIEIATTDNALINVTLPEPLDNDVSGYIEIHGTVKSKSTLSCTNYVCFPSHMTNDFGE